jgi:hypothetical protein
MGYTMKTNIPGLLGINEELSTPDVPVFEKNLGKAWGYAKMDRTIDINSKLNDKQKKDAHEHELLHVMQMRSGEAWYDNNNVYHHPDKSKPIQVYQRIGGGMLVNGKIIKVGDPNNPIEKPIYNKTGKHAAKIS